MQPEAVGISLGQWAESVREEKYGKPYISLGKMDAPGRDWCHCVTIFLPDMPLFYATGLRG